MIFLANKQNGGTAIRFCSVGYEIGGEVNLVVGFCWLCNGRYYFVDVFLGDGLKINGSMVLCRQVSITGF